MTVRGATRLSALVRCALFGVLAFTLASCAVDHAEASTPREQAQTPPAVRVDNADKRGRPRRPWRPAVSSSAQQRSTLQAIQPVASEVDNQDRVEAEVARSRRLVTTPMFDLRTGQSTSLDDLVRGDRAVLIWYWTPHIELSLVEAPGIARFAHKHAANVEVVAIGQGGTKAAAMAWLDRAPIGNVTVLWDESAELSSLPDMHIVPKVQLYSHTLQSNSAVIRLTDATESLVTAALRRAPWAPRE